MIKRRKLLSFIVLCSLAVSIGSTCVDAASPTPESLNFFENNIRPLLLKRCIKCHGTKKAESGLQVNSLGALLIGGDSGPALLPGKPDESLLITAIRHEDGYEMPPDDKLDGADIDLLVRWIKEGAAWPQGMTLGKVGPQLRGGRITDAEKAFWSFQPIRDPAPPEDDTDKWSLNDLDRFVLSRLKNSKLSPRSPADKRTLLRRATFDLTGLPPTPGEIEAFLDDTSPDAFAKVIDRLLVSQAYGERWGRHWLDVVRYADTAGETADFPTPLSWKYRNWVIDALNADKPYDEFIREQIAGDLMAKQQAKITEEQYRSMHIATGFIAISRRFGFDSENYHNLTIQDTIDTLGQSVLGLTLGCARCHDHKFDPVNRQDYYAFYGMFESTRYSFPGSEEKKRPYDLVPAVLPARAQALKADYDSKVAAIEAMIKEQQAIREAQQKVMPDNNPIIVATNKRLNELSQQRDTLKWTAPYEMIYGVVDQDQPKNSKIQIRGDILKLGEEVPRRNLEILGGHTISNESGSGRLELAEWLTSADNPLTARVIANRLWQYHFGRGLVGTENDFGTRGEAPTNPELLDWLARRLQENGWSLKSLHRLIMSSATYQQSSAFDQQAAEIDPESRMLWRFPRRRLSAEEIRDALLFISGDLDSTMGEEHPFPEVGQWNFTQHSPFYGVYETNRRSVYLMQQRLKRHPFLALFDGADPNASTPNRILTSVPTQALYLMNNQFVHERSGSYAQKLIRNSKNEIERVRAAYQSILSRTPDQNELAAGLQFLSLYRKKLQMGDIAPEIAERTSLAGFLRTLFVRNEFLFVD